MPRTSILISIAGDRQEASAGTHSEPFRIRCLASHLPCAAIPGCRPELLQSSDYEKHNAN